MIIVTGGNGFLGSKIVKALNGRGESVRVLTRNVEKAKEKAKLAGLTIDFVEGDVRNLSSLLQAFDHGEAVIHTVAIAIEKKGVTYEEVNTQGTINVLEASHSAGIKRFINISQLGADAQLPYRFLASKGRAQEYVASSGLNWTAFRPSVIWGPEDEFANTFARLAKLTPLIFPIIDRNAKFQPVWVQDVAQSVIQALYDKDTYSKEYELGGPEVLSLLEIERRTLQAIGARRTFVPFPRSILNIIVTIMEATLPSPPVTRSLLELLSVNNVTKENSIFRFVADPKPFTPETTSHYMKTFSIRETVAKYMGWN